MNSDGFSNVYENNLNDSSVELVVTKGQKFDSGFLYISLKRLTILGIMTFGVYSWYWSYCNWRHIKLRDSSRISPFWRTWFYILFIRSLFVEIKNDEAYNNGLLPRFSPTMLLIGIILLSAFSGAISGLPSANFEELALVLLFSGIVGDYLCLLPVQAHINRGQEKMKPNSKFKSLSSKGHIICYTIVLVQIIVGVIIGYFGT